MAQTYGNQFHRFISPNNQKEMLLSLLEEWDMENPLFAKPSLANNKNKKQSLELTLNLQQQSSQCIKVTSSKIFMVKIFMLLIHLDQNQKVLLNQSLKKWMILFIGRNCQQQELLMSYKFTKDKKTKKVRAIFFRFFRRQEQDIPIKKVQRFVYQLNGINIMKRRKEIYNFFSKCNDNFKKSSFRMFGPQKFIGLANRQPIKSFYKKINNSQLRQIYDNQIVKLKNILHFIWKNNLHIPYQRFESDRSLFCKFHLFKMMDQYEDFSYGKVTGDIQLNSITPPVYKSFIVKAKAFFGVQIKYRLIQFVDFIAKQELNFRNQAKFRNCLQKMINPKIFVTHSKTIFKKANYIVSVRCFNEQGEEIGVYKDKQDNLFAYLLAGSQNKIIFKCRFPTNECCTQFIQKLTKQFFNQRIEQ